jgi:hypothetical protein
MKNPVLLSSMVLIALIACASPAEPTLLPSSASPQPTQTSTIEATKAPAEALPLEAAEPVVELARIDLAQRLSIPVETIEVVRVEAVEWPDASLGCPEEGLAYAQVISPGFWIVLEVLGNPYTYHSGLDKPFLCTTNTAGILPGKISDLTVKDGGPNETKDEDVIIAPPSDRK